MRHRRLLCLLFISCFLTPGYESSNKTGSSSTNNKEWIDDVIAVLIDQPIKEVQCKPFRIQPKIHMNYTAAAAANYVNTSASESYYVTVTLRFNESNPTTNSNSTRSLMGDDAIPFVNNWANFTNLAISHYGQQYWLEFSISSLNGNESSEWTILSRPFDVAEFPFNVSMSILVPSQSSHELYTVEITLSIWDFTTNALAQPNIINDTVWHYIISLKQNDSSSDINKGEVNGSFPLRAHHTPQHRFNLTTIGYQYQFVITMYSPSYATTLTNVSDPFDVVWKMPVNNLKYSTIVLTFNGSSKDISGVEDKFCTTFLNHFGRRHSQVLWRNYSLQQADALAIEVTLAGNTKNVEEALSDIRSDIQNAHQMNFRHQAFILQQTLTIDGSSYSFDASQQSDVTLFGLPVTSVFTIVLMSFLCSAFVVLVIIWSVREKKMLEAYSRRIKTRSNGRQNGHINTAFDSNESVPDRNVYYMSGHDRHRQPRRESAYNSERESRLRRCSSGGFHRNYRRMRRLGSDEGDMYVGNGIPLDDELVFTDADKQDDVFRDVYFSPTSECMPTFASSSSSFHDEYLLKDAQPHSGRANYAHIPTHKYKGSKRKCSVTASTVSGSLNSLATNSQSASRILSNSTIDSFSLHRPPLGWSSHDDNKICNGSRGLVYYQY